MIIALYVIGWIVCAIIVAILASKIEKEPVKTYAPTLFLWPIALIILTCEACVMYIEYVTTRKERVENLKQEKRDEVENVLKEI